MEEMAILENELTEIKEKIDGRNIEEIGVIELRRIRHDLEALHNLNLDLQERSRLTPASELDTEDLRTILNKGDKLYFDVGDTLRPIVETLKVKSALGMSKVNERRELISNKQRNLEIISSLRTELESLRSTASRVTDDSVKTTLEGFIQNRESEIKTLEEVDKGYDESIERLDQEIDIIRFGGFVEELEHVNEESKPLSEDEERDLRERLAKDLNSELENQQAQEENISEDIIPPLAFEEENIPEDVVLPPELDEEEKEDTNVVLPIFNGEEIKPLPEEYNEEEIRELPEELNELDEEGEDLVIPEVDSEESIISPDTPVGFLDKTYLEDAGKDPNVSLRDLMEENEPEEEEIEAEVIAPKPGLWKRVGAVVLAAAAALAAGIGIGKLVNRNNGSDEMEEVEETEVTPEATQTPSETEEPSKSQPSGPTGPTPASTPAPTQKPTPAPTPTPTPVPSSSPVAELSRGETAYNTETGIEVTQSGNAYRHNQDGTTTVESNRSLSQTSNGTSVVTAGDLQPDTPQQSTRTGQEVSEQQARQTMTTQEQSNLDLAINGIDFDAFFEQEYGLGK